MKITRFMLTRCFRYQTGLPTHICVTNHHEVSIPPVHQPQSRNHRSYHFATLRLGGLLSGSLQAVPTCWTRPPAQMTPASSLCHLGPRLVLRVVQRLGARFVVARPLQATVANQALLLPHRNRGSCTTAATVRYCCRDSPRPRLQRLC